VVGLGVQVQVMERRRWHHPEPLNAFDLRKAVVAGRDGTDMSAVLVHTVE